MTGSWGIFGKSRVQDVHDGIDSDDGEREGAGDTLGRFFCRAPSDHRRPNKGTSIHDVGTEAEEGRSTNTPNLQTNCMNYGQRRGGG